jgi:GNAT superfamily N-acetyltransferase
VTSTQSSSSPSAPGSQSSRPCVRFLVTTSSCVCIPSWRENQAEAVRSSCTNDERDVLVAVADNRPVGFVAVALNAFHERMGWIEIIGVDPAYQRRGISSRLTEFAIDHMRSGGMDVVVVETGGDPGHRPARAAYEAAGFSLLPIARYFRLLD